jgi:hypothetical protein
MSSILNSMVMSVASMSDLHELEALAAAVRERKNELARSVAHKAARDIRPGDVVRFSDRIRPTYLKGLTAKVTKINRETVTIECPTDMRYGRFSAARAVRLPLTLIAERVLAG